MVPLSAMDTPPARTRGLLSTPQTPQPYSSSNDSFERLYLNSPVVATPVRVVASPILVPINTQRRATTQNLQALATFSAGRAARYNISPHSYMNRSSYVHPTYMQTPALISQPESYSQYSQARRTQSTQYGPKHSSPILWLVQPDSTQFVSNPRPVRLAQQNDISPAPIIPGFLALFDTFVPERLPRTNNRYLDGSLLSSNNNNNSINNEKQG
jgi:hypothetical protein